MKQITPKSALLCTAVMAVNLSAPVSVSAHGLIESPPSRNWLCGAITKPDEAARGVAEYEFCADAFAEDPSAGYQFMSVLTHDLGRAEVSPLPNNVCSFDTETFDGTPTPWDQPIDWPATPMTAGRNEFVWAIEWGPHFDDSEDFRYWITKPDYQFQVGVPLTWDDFEEAPFCDLSGYDDTNPSATPDIVPLKGSNQFITYCDVPQRQGHHVIYGEWGRNQFTFERFHGCMDVEFAGGNSVTAPVSPVTPVAPETPVIPVEARFRTTFPSRTVVGSATVSLDAGISTGENLSYVWSIDAPDRNIYQLSSYNEPQVTLTMTDPNAAQTANLTLLVTGDAGSDSRTIEFTHRPEVPMTMLNDLGPLTAQARTLQAGDTVSIRTVSETGVDSFYPAQPLVITDRTANAAQWTYELALAVNAMDAGVELGVLTGGSTLMPQIDATSNRVYTMPGSGIVSAFVVVSDPAQVPEQPVYPVAPVQPVAPVAPVAPQPPVAMPSTGEIDNSCTVTLRGGANPYWIGLDVATDASSVSLDFTGTGLDLSENVNLDAGVFKASIDGQVLTLVKPSWVSSRLAGYVGMGANNNLSFMNFTMPSCKL